MVVTALSLHFDLRKGDHANLEVVATASLKWVEALRASARHISPDAEIRIELVDAQVGSLRLNTLLQWAEDGLESLQVGSKYPRLKALALSLIVFVPFEVIPTLDFYFGDQPEISLSKEDRERLDALLNELKANPEVKEKKEAFYRTVEKDPAITAVGVAQGPTDPPIILVPSSEFAVRGGLWALTEDQQERTTYPVVDVTLIRPSLTAAKRAWTFKTEVSNEFNATMRDERFLRALQRGAVQEKLRIGVLMKLRLKVEEHKVGGVWMLKRGGRSVVEVIDPKID